MVIPAAVPWAEPATLSADILRHLPEDGWRYELVDGRLMRMPPTGYDHGRITPRLLARLFTFNEEHRLGVVCGSETGFLLSREGEPDTVLAPDAAFVTAERAPRGSVPGFPRLVPDLVAEVASPEQTHPQMTAKAKVYLDYGVRTVWVVWPRTRTVDVWQSGNDTSLTLAEHDELDGGRILPGFSVPVRDLFP